MTDAELSPDAIRAFVDSMPRGYRYVFSERGIRDHASLALRRGGAIARVGQFHAARDLGAAPLCVVADDRPGLLAFISAALVMERLDVVHAEAYTRRRDDASLEAVDIFWVRDLRATHVEELSQGRLQSLEDALGRLLRGEVSVAEASAAAAGSRPPIGAYEASVRFLGQDDGALSTLEVQTVDRAGLLLALAHALFARGVQIVRCEVHTVRDAVRDRFEIQEVDGSPISAARRLEIQVAVLDAIDPVRPR